MDTRVQTGKLGEQLAKEYLTTLGYVVVNENWRCRSGEVDLIALDGKVLVFVEVRTQRGNGFSYGTPQESVHSRKQQQVRKLASIYLSMQGITDREVRFDMISVVLPRTGTAKIDHIPNAF
jgi:putative endonuclease